MHVMEPELLRVREVQRVLGLGHTKTHDLIRSGALKAIRIGRAVRVSRAALDEFIRQLEEEAQSADR